MTVFRRGLDLVLVALVVAVVLVGLASYLAPAVGGRALAIRSGSMVPAIGVGSLVIAVPVDPAAVRIGDVVTIGLPSGVILTHRVEEIVQQDDRRMFRLRGDANPSPDPALVTQDQLRGRVDVVIPLLGYLAAMLSSPVGVVALLLIAATLVVAGWFLDDLTEDRPSRARPARTRRTLPRPAFIDDEAALGTHRAGSYR
jgi:signal peptidase